MVKKINYKCQECSKENHRKIRNSLRNKPCYAGRACNKKISYYRKIEYYRKKLRDNHRYLKYKSDKCSLCQSKDNLEVHHIIPQIRNGIDSWTNTITLCTACHKIITKYYRAVGWERKKIE